MLGPQQLASLRSRRQGLCGETLYSLTLELQQVSPLPLGLLCDPGQTLYPSLSLGGRITVGGSYGFCL